MKYPQLVSTPAVVKEWLEAELECLGIDSAAYARTVLSLLTRDTIDPAEVIQSGYVLVANKCGRGAGGPSGPHPPRTREEELKRAEVIECLQSASEDHGGIQLLVDQLISMLKQLPTAPEPAAGTVADTSRRPAAVDPPPSDDPVLRYEAAFPALSRESPSVIPLTFFSKMGRTAAKLPATLSAWLPAGGGRADAAPTDLWRAGRLPTTAVWPTALDLSLLLPPPACPEQLSGYTSLRTATLELAGGPATPPPPPKPPELPEPAETARAIHPSAETHFQPIRRASGGDGDDVPAEWPPPATYDARLYTRSDSGGLYLEDEELRPSADPPQKYMIYQDEAVVVGAGRGLAPKFKLSCNEKYCQTDEAAPADGASRDLLQILVSGEQAGAARGTRVDDDDDDSSYEVLSSLQQTLHSIYEDGSEAADSGAEPEPLSAGEELEPEPARRPSAFARVRRPPTGHRPLYLRGGGADSLLAAVYTGGAWSLGGGPPEPDHRPLYARQPAAAAAGLAEFAEHRLLSSGRISGAVYRHGPTEYPALRYQLAGRDLPEVTFCRLSGDAHSAGSRKEEPSAAGDQPAVWEGGSDAVRSSREPSVGSDVSAWQGGADGTLWQAAGERERRDRSADRALWEARADPGRRRSSVDSAIWEPAGGVVEREGAAEASLWEPPRSLVEPESSAENVIWEPPRSRAERESSVEMTIWESAGERAEREETTNKNIWETGVAPASREKSIGDTLWESRELTQREMSIDETLWESRDDLSQREKSIEETLWEAQGNAANREKTVEKPWELRGELPLRDESVDRNLWGSPSNLYPRDGSIEKILWESPNELPHRDKAIEKTIWESAGDFSQRGEPLEKTLWGLPAELSRERSAGTTLWNACGEPPAADRPSDGPLWEQGQPPAEEAAWPPWDGPLIRAPEQIWRRAEPAAGPVWAGTLPVTGGGQEEVRRLLWRLGGDDVLAQTGLYPADELADVGRNWEFIDVNNVKNKIDTDGGDDGGPLASELADGGPGWRMLPALRQLSECLGLIESRPLPDGVALKAWALEEQWRRDEGPQRPARDRRIRRSDRKRPCSYFMEGNCKRNDCKFSHDLSAITCVFWEESGCFKGAHCPFLHGYPADDEEDEDSSDSAKRAVPKKSFKLEKEDFPSLHNMKKWHRNDEEDSRKAGRRGCRRHKSFSDATLGVGSGDGELHRPALGGRCKRRRHHSKSEGVRPADTGARRP